MSDGSSTPGPDPPVSGHALSPGAVLGDRYRIVRHLGRGGMGDVWQAYDLKLRVEVALKSLRAEHFADERHRESMRREVRAARDVLSPGVCRIFDLVEVDGREFVSMEYIDGSTLADVLRRRGPLPLPEAREIASQFLAGLEAIHAAGLVHRDLKPENLMITRSDRVVVMDFGIAKNFEPRRGAADPDRGDGTTVLESPGRGAMDGSGPGAGTIAGTPAYMAPEQMQGVAVDARADIFSAGIVLAEMVGVDRDDGSKSRERVWTGVRQDPPLLPETPWQPVILRCISPGPEGRYPSARALSRALEEITLRVDGADDRTPYPGLATFTEQNAEFFFGREADIEEAWRKLQTLQMMAVIGPSGVGKSSFLRAGLIPTRPQGWSCVLATPGPSPFSSLAQALAPLLAGDTEAVQELVRFEQPEAAISAAGRWRRRHEGVLLVLDQFEELFTQNGPETQQRFATLLGRLAFEADVRILVSIRDDFFFRCHELPPLRPIFSEPRPLGSLTGAALRRALVQPALICGYRFEDESLVDEMVEEVGVARGALPLLAFAAARLWDRRDRKQGQLTREAYEAIGGVGGALAQHADATLEEIGVEHQPVVRELFRNLVTAEGTRRSVGLDELLSVFEDQSSARWVVQQLVDARLLTTYELREEREDDPRTRVEIVHEALLASWPRLRRWQTQDADGAQLRDQLRQAADLWEQRSRADDLLWTGTSLREFELWRARYPGGLSRSESEYADAMVARERRRRRRRVIVAGASIAALLAVLLIVSISRQQAVRQARRAEAKELLAMGRQYLEEDPTWSFACGVASLERLDDREARLFVMETLWKAPVRFVIPASGGGWRVDFSPDGRWLAGALGNETVRVWSVEGGEPIVLEGLRGTQNLVSFHPTRPWLLAVSQDTLSSIRVWSVPDGRVVFAPRMEDHSDAAWGARGETLLTATREQRDTLLWRSWSVEDWTPTVLGRGGTFRGHQSRRVDAFGRRYLDFRGRELRVHALEDLRAGVAPTLLGTLPVAVKDAIFVPSEEHVLSVDGEGEIRLWSATTATGEPLRVVGRHAASETVRSDPTGTIVGSCGDDGNALLWDLEAPPGADALVLKRDAGTIHDIAYHPDGTWIAVETGEGWLSLWPTTRRYPWILRGHSEVVRGVVFDPEGNSLVSVSGDMTVRTWSLHPDADVPVWERPFRDYYDLVDIDLDGTGRWIILGGPGGGSEEEPGASLISRSTGESRALPLLTHSVVIRSVALGSSGRLAAASGWWHVRGPITVWDLEANTSWLLDAGDSTTVRDLHFTPEGRLLAASEIGLRIWDPIRRTHELLLPGSVRDVDVSADGRRVLSTGQAGTFLLDLDTGESRELSEHRDQTTCALDPSGEWIATGHRLSGEIRFGPASEGPVHVLLGHEGGVRSLDFDPQGRWIASAGEDGTIRLWPIPEGTPFHTLPHDEFLTRLRTLTNIRMVPDPEKPGGWINRNEPFTGWAVAPTW